MTLAELPLPSGVRRIADLLLDAARRGVVSLWGRGAHANAPAGEKRALLQRLTRILRFAFLLYAVWMETPPPHQHPRAPRLRRTAPRGYRPRRACFRIFPRYRILIDDGSRDAGERRPVPPALARAARDPVLAAQRARDALLRALEDPLAYIRRIARRLPTQLMVIGWRPPKRPPPTDRPAYWDDLIDGWREAVHQLRDWRRRRRDILHGAPA
ncbi:MAG: hypothetical protein NW200_00660 [Hyphomonadaceae bacterium]|nr:hypothetical protein [Hyphomonadaceae bacterium]